MSIESSIDRLAAAIEKLADAVVSPVVVSSGYVPPGEVIVQPRPATAAEEAEIAAADAPKKPRGRPKKTTLNIITAAGESSEGSAQGASQDDPQPAAQTADTATEVVSDQTSSGQSASTAAEPATESLTKTEVIQILTGLQKSLEEKATTIDEKRAAAQRCRDVIKSVVGTESLKDAKPEHFGKIKSAVLKVLNNE